MEEHIKLCTPNKYIHLCQKIEQEQIGSVIIPEGERQYSNRFEIKNSGAGCDLKIGNIIHTLSVRNGIPITLKDRQYFLVPESFVIYVEGEGDFVGPVNGWSVLRNISRERTESGLIIPEKEQDTNLYEAMVVETNSDFVKVGNKVWINKAERDFMKFPITIDGVECFLYPDAKILAKE